MSIAPYRVTVRYEISTDPGGWDFAKTLDDARTRAMQPDGRGVVYGRNSDGTRTGPIPAERRVEYRVDVRDVLVAVAA